MLKNLICAKKLVVCAWASYVSLMIGACASAQCACGSGASGSYSLSMGMPGLPMGASAGTLIEANAIYLNVTVPEKAVLKINNDPTISEGPNRYFVIKDLDPTKEYKFTLVAETANAANVAMQETKTVTLKPGSLETVALKPVKRKPKDTEETGDQDKLKKDSGDVLVNAPQRTVMNNIH
jgi:uncharacterized protein (TIGR03000 family)